MNDKTQSSLGRKRRGTALLGVEISAELNRKLGNFCRVDRRTKRAVLEMAIEEYLRKHQQGGES